MDTVEGLVPMKYSDYHQQQSRTTDRHQVPSDGMGGAAHSTPHEVFSPQNISPESIQLSKLMSTL